MKKVPFCDMIGFNKETKIKQKRVLSILNSILHFIEKDIKEIEKTLGKILTGEKDADDLSQTVLNKTMNLARYLVCELYEKLDDEIRESISRKATWTIERYNESKELLDVVGTLRFKRTGYEDKRTVEYIYLLDKILGFEGHQRITLGAAAKILEESILTSYEKGGKAVSAVEAASKQAVKKLVHETVIEMPQKKVKEKKKLRHLHIVADEDHVSAQFWKRKGDLQKNAAGMEVLENSRFVLDKFHMIKYINLLVTFNIIFV